MVHQRSIRPTYLEDLLGLVSTPSLMTYLLSWKGNFSLVTGTSQLTVTKSETEEWPYHCWHHDSSRTTKEPFSDNIENKKTVIKNQLCFSFSQNISLSELIKEKLVETFQWSFITGQVLKGFKADMIAVFYRFEGSNSHLFLLGKQQKGKNDPIKRNLVQLLFYP